MVPAASYDTVSATYIKGLLVAAGGSKAKPFVVPRRLLQRVSCI